MDAFIGTILPWALRFAPYGFTFCDGKSLLVSQYQAVYSLLGATFGGSANVSFNVPDLRGRTMIGMGQAPVPGSSIFQIGAFGGAELQNIVLTPNNIPVHSHAASFAPTIGSQNITIPAVPGTPSTPPSLTATKLQANPSNTGASNVVSPTNNVLASSPSGNLGTTMWVNSVGATPVTLGGLTVTLDPGTQGTPTIPAQTVPVTTVTGGTVTVSPTGPTTQQAITVKTMPPYLVLNFIICLNGIYPTQD